MTATTAQPGDAAAQLAALARQLELLRKDVRAVVKVAQIFYSGGWNDSRERPDLDQPTVTRAAYKLGMEAGQRRTELRTRMAAPAKAGRPPATTRRPGRKGRRLRSVR